MSSPELLATHTSTVTPDQIDELGHMNVRWYGANATAATKAVVDQLGIGPVETSATYTRHHHEQMEGSALEVRSGVLSTGETLRLYHELRNQATGVLAATFVHQLPYTGPVEMAVVPLPEHGRPRSIDLEIDRLALAPALDELHRRSLANRLARTVTTEDSMGPDVVPAWLTNNLLWGGEPPDGHSSWIRETADGDRVAFASMETHLRINRPVTVGTRIQSFAAAIHIGEKILHELNWVYDLDAGDCLAVAETIDLAFSIPNRRSRVMPPEMRDRMMVRFHPDLAAH